MTLSNKDTAVNAVGRTDNSQWLAVELPEGDYGWVLTQFISTEGDVATLDVVTPDILATWAAAAAVEAAPVVSDTASMPLCCRRLHHRQGQHRPKCPPAY